MITAPSITIPIKINAHQCTKQRLQAPFSFCTSDGAAILTKKEAQQCELRLIFYLYCHGSQNQRRFDLKAPYHLLTSPCTRQLASQLLIHNGATGFMWAWPSDISHDVTPAYWSPYQNPLPTAPGPYPRRHTACI